MFFRSPALVFALAAGPAGQPSRVAVLAELFRPKDARARPPTRCWSSCSAPDGVSDPWGSTWTTSTIWDEGCVLVRRLYAPPANCQRTGPDSVYTPQIVVDGRDAVPGNDNEAVRRVIAAAASRPRLPVSVVAQASGERARLTIALPAAPETTEAVHLVAAITEDDLTSVVRRGENHGRTLHHVAVARTVRHLAALVGTAVTLDVELPIKRSWVPGALRAVVWLEGERSRGVYGAASTRVTEPPR